MPSSPSPSSLPLDPSLSPEFNRAISLSLSSALASATHAEQVNSAKLLSVSQLHNYDQFRGMVAGAHLRAMNLSNSPLDAIVSQAGARGTRTEVGAVDGGGGSDAAAWMVEVGRGAMRGKEARLSERRSEELLQESRTATAAAQQPTTRQQHESAALPQPLTTAADAFSLMLRCVSAHCVCSARAEEGLEAAGWRAQRRRRPLPLPASAARSRTARADERRSGTGGAGRAAGRPQSLLRFGHEGGRWRSRHCSLRSPLPPLPRRPLRHQRRVPVSSAEAERKTAPRLAPSLRGECEPRGGRGWTGEAE